MDLDLLNSGPVPLAKLSRDRGRAAVWKSVAGIDPCYLPRVKLIRHRTLMILWRAA
jgi:hypothetical protein